MPVFCYKIIRYIIIFRYYLVFSIYATIPSPLDAQEAVSNNSTSLKSDFVSLPHTINQTLDVDFRRSSYLYPIDVFSFMTGDLINHQLSNQNHIIEFQFIGLSNEESYANILMSNRYDRTQIQDMVASINNPIILYTHGSTAGIVAKICIEANEINNIEAEWRPRLQHEILREYNAKDDTFAALWSPNVYLLETSKKAVTLCDGAQVGLKIPGVIAVAKPFADSNPDEVARLLALYLRGWSWARTHRDEARALLKADFAADGIDLTDEQLDREFDSRPTFSLAEQLAMFDRAGGQSTADQWMGCIAKFMVETGSIEAVPDPTTYITDRFLKIIDATPELKALATEFDQAPPAPDLTPSACD